MALTANQQSLLVNETGKFRVWKMAVNARDIDLREPPVGHKPASCWTTCRATPTT